MITMHVDNLLAHWAVHITFEQRHSETVGHTHAEVAGAKNRVVSILLGGDTSEKAASVGLGYSRQPLALAVVRCYTNQVLQHLLVELEGGLLLGHVLLLDLGRTNPGLALGCFAYMLFYKMGFDVFDLLIHASIGGKAMAVAAIGGTLTTLGSFAEAE